MSPQLYIITAEARVGSIALLTVHGRDVDDPSPVVLFHVWQAQTRGVEDSRKVDCDDTVPFGDGEVFHRRDVLDAGVVDQDVDSGVL